MTTALTCASCKGSLESLGQVPVRVGGHVGATQFFFGDFAEMGEQIWRLDTYRCSGCGRMEFFDHDRSLPKTK